MSNNTAKAASTKTKAASKSASKSATAPANQGESIIGNILGEALNPNTNPVSSIAPTANHFEVLSTDSEDIAKLKQQLADSESRRVQAEGELQSIKSTVKVKKDRKPRKLLDDSVIETRFVGESGRCLTLFSSLENHSNKMIIDSDRETRKKGHSLAISIITMQNNMESIQKDSKVPATLRDAKKDLNILKYKVIDLCVAHGLMTKEQKAKEAATEVTEVAETGTESAAE